MSMNKIQSVSQIDARIELPEHYQQFLKEHSAVFGDLNELVSRLLIEEINRTHEFLKANSPASIPVKLLDDLSIGLLEGK